MKELQNIWQGHYFQSCTKGLFSAGRGKAVITRCNRLQCVTKCYKNNSTQRLVEKLLKTCNFLKDVISCYNLLQQVTMHYKRLQEKGMGTTFKVAPEVFFLIEREKRYNRLQCVTKCYKNSATQGLVEKLLKISFFLKEVISC